jgi:glycosyltransferase involved in cell wall biosynthesis
MIATIASQPEIDLSPTPVSDQAPEVSIVIPCLDEAETLGACLRKARACLEQHGIHGEIIVADNGSRDGSQDIARRQGARVVPVSARGYGNALMGGIAAARGRFVIMGDADDSYDFGETHRFVEKLREGYDLVQGCRLPAGGGTVLPGAMPFLHRWLGNPLFSCLVRVMFGSPLHDVYCGLRGFTRAHYERLQQRCVGMEFAIEMLVKSSLFGCKMTEVPTTLYPDGRTAHPPHLRTFRDGWRTLRFLLLYSPRWLFLIPGLMLILLGLFGYGLALPGATVLGARLDAHTLLFASLSVLLGHQSILFALFTKRYAASVGFLPEDARVERFLRVFNLERGLLAGLGCTVVGGALLLASIWRWYAANFGDLDYPSTMRWVIPGVTLTALGFQMVFASFFVSILEIRRLR